MKAGGASVGIPIVMFARAGMVVPVSKGGGPVGVTVAMVGNVEYDPVDVGDEEVECGPGALANCEDAIKVEDDAGV